ncbi:MAG: EVE domain-containing protein [Calditrichaeota bacterium]|nr:EVE domain-containing protein [Calditrichota bacterium]
MQYWLMKTEPETFSWEDLKNCPDRREHWDGIRNYLARNHMRQMAKGDLVFIYHSVVKPPAIAGIARVVRTAYPDHTQFDPSAKYYDPKSAPDNPRWDMVDVQAFKELDRPIPITELKKIPGLENMALFRMSRLSVQPVTAEEWERITALRKIEAL